MRTLLFLTLSLTVPLAGCFPAARAGDELPSAEEVLAGIDQNMLFETRTTTVKMTVTTPRRTREFKMVTFGRGQTEAAIEYLEPAREKGTRLLRNDDELWMYLPAVERTQKISGHMLRQGMSGSDVSYEDMMASTKLREDYKAEIVGEETIDGRPCWKLELTANDDTITYTRRVSYVDKEVLLPLRQELYAVSGMMVKRWQMSDIQEFEGGRRFPTRMVIEDQLQQGSSTTLEFSDISFGVELEEEVFSTRWLERG